MRLTELLLKEGRVAADPLKRAIEMQRMVGGRLGSQLLAMKAIGEEELLAAIGRQQQTRTVSGADLREIAPEVLRLVPAKLAKRYRIVPFRLQGRTLMIASIDPGDVLVEDEIGLLTSCLARTHVALEVRIHEALERHYGLPAPTNLRVLAQRLSNEASGAVPAVVPAPPPSLSPAPATRPTPAPPAVVPTPAPVRRPPPTPGEMLYIELDEEDAALLATPTTPLSSASDSPPPVNAAPSPESISAETGLEIAAQKLQEIDIRDEIADAVLEFCGAFFERRLLLFRRGEQILGWRGEGEGVQKEHVRGVEIATNEPSVFLGLLQGSPLWLGPLPPLPANQKLIRGLGGVGPKDCLILPVTLRSKTVCLLYLDNLGRSVAGAPLAELRRLVAKAAVAFEVYILKNKIRTL